MTIAFVLTWAMLLSIGRLAHLSLGTAYLSTADQQSLYTLTVQRLRGAVYDRHGQPLTQMEQIQKVALTASPKVISYIHSVCSATEKEQLLQLLAQRRPVLVQTDTPFSVKGAISFSCRQFQPTYQAAIHTVGYLDNTGTIGWGGLENSYNHLLTTHQTLSVTYACDAGGGALAGVDPTLHIPRLPSDFGVHTTLDLTVQQIIEDAFPTDAKGAIVVQKARSGELLGLYSAPTFSPVDVTSAMQDPRLPLLNRTLSAYNVGSVFKLCVAAAALERGIVPQYTYTCTGSIDCSLPFACHKTDGHGSVTMTQALAQSCNTYFIHLATQIGGQAVYDMASQMGFGRNIYLCEQLIGQEGQLPSLTELSRSPAELANFAIGQGVFLATPLQISAAVNAIADGGVYFTPRLVTHTVDRLGTRQDMRITSGKRILSPETAQALSLMMQAVVTQGTGTLAATPLTTGCGKTATAQTGMLDDAGNPITHAWFTGFFPALEPQYVITVMVEGGVSGGRDAAPIFKQICEAMATNQLL